MVSWLFLGLCGFVFVLGSCLAGRSAFRRSRQYGHPLADLLLLTALVPVALFSVHPYLGNRLVGAGDSYHYALQAADAVTQIRHGVMPVFVGQSDYAFNGSIHTLRTAPYFTHLAGLLDWLTGRRLSFVTLQNLTVACTAVLAAWAAYAACLLVSGGRRLAAGILAALYVLSPAIMGPLALHDMFATYMAAPWLILCWAGIAGSWRHENVAAAQFLAAGALGLCWYAHSPLAAWLTLVWGAGQIGRLLLAGGGAGQWRRQAAAGLLLAGLVAYLFTSVGTLGEGPRSAVTHPVFSWESLRQFLRGEFIPFAAFPTPPSIQLGWAMWGLLLGGGMLALLHRRRDGLTLTGLLVALLPFLVPLPWLSEVMWRGLPDQLVMLTNWPVQRLCPLLGSGIVIAFAAALRADGRGPGRPGRWVEVLLAVALLWSAAETAAIHRRPDVAKLAPAVQEVLFAPENLRLTRYSYAFFERPPAYFTHGWTSPEFESRLLDAERDIVQDNAGAVLAAAGDTGTGPVVIEREVTLSLPGPAEHLLVFAFAHPELAGEVTIRGAGVERNYTLPRSGEELAFGSAPGCNRTIPLRLARSGPQTITVSASVPGVSLRTLPVPRDLLPVRLSGQIPYTAEVRADAAAFLETPRVHLAGYQATVGGRPAPVLRSPNGLVMVPVPPGSTRVVLTHPGPPVLRFSWFLSVACLAVWPWVLARSAAAPVGADLSWTWIRENNLGAGLARGWRRGHRPRLVAALVAVLVAAAALHLWRAERAYGSLRLVVELPKRPVSRAEPLLTLGRPGAADCIYVIYEDPRHVRIGVDHWAYGGPVSDPLPISHAGPQTIEITIGGLYPASLWWRRPAQTTGPAGTGPLRISLNGRLVLTRDTRFYAATPAEVAVGRNPAGSSVAGERFSGRILRAERFIPAAR